jgi:hypothetical protein
VRGQSPEERVTVRQREIRPLLNELRDYIQANKGRFSAKSNMTKAYYILNRGTDLTYPSTTVGSNLTPTSSSGLSNLKF